MSYTDDLNIDKNSLDYEWEKQAKLYLQYSEQYANALWEKDKLKEDLEILKAEINLDIRQNPDEYDLPTKTTEKMIDNTVQVQEAVQILSSKLLEATHEFNVLRGALTAFEHKKVALEKMSQLYLAGYWAEPMIPTAAYEKAEEGYKQKHEKELEKNTRIKGKTKAEADEKVGIKTSANKKVKSKRIKGDK